MEFAAPIAGLTAAGLITPALLALHMLRLRRRPLRVSTIRFWPRARRETEANVPLRLPRPSWELLLQLLGAWALCAALARPLAGGGDPAGARIILAVDRSASMLALHADTTRFALAVDAALQELRALDGREVTLASLAGEALVEAGPTRVPGDLRRALASLAPTDEALNEDAARDLLTALVGGVSEDDPRDPATIIVLTDGDLRLGSIPGAEVRVRSVVPADAAPPDNVGIVSIAARRDYRDPGTVLVFVRMVSTRADLEACPVLFLFDDEPVGSRLAAFEEVRGAREARVAFEFPTARGGVLTARLARPDALAADNESAVVLGAIPSPRIVLVSPEGDDPRASWLVAEVLDELSPRSLRRLTAAEYDDAMREGTIAPTDLIVFERVTPAIVPPIPSLSFGAGVAPWTIEPSDRTGEVALAWTRRHPLLRGVSLDGLFVSRVANLASSEPVEEIATSAGGPLIVTGSPGGIRRVVVLFAPAESNWPAGFGFPVFLANAVEYLTLQAEEAAAFSTGELVRLTRSPDAGIPREIRFEGPSGAVSRVVRTEGEGVLAQGLPRAGVYRVSGEVRETRVAVNLHDERESRVRIGGSTMTTAAGEVSAAASGTREVWWWFVVLGVALLTIEWAWWIVRARVE